MKMRLTDLGVKKLALTSNGQITYWDVSTPGFGLRCSAKRKSYVVMYGERRQLKTLGRHPDLALADARKQARLFLSKQAVANNETTEYKYSAVVQEYLADCQRRLETVRSSVYE